MHLVRNELPLVDDLGVTLLDEGRDVAVVNLLFLVGQILETLENRVELLVGALELAPPRITE